MDSNGSEIELLTAQMCALPTDIHELVSAFLPKCDDCYYSPYIINPTDCVNCGNFPEDRDASRDSCVDCSKCLGCEALTCTQCRNDCQRPCEMNQCKVCCDIFSCWWCRPEIEFEVSCLKCRRYCSYCRDSDKRYSNETGCDICTTWICKDCKMKCVCDACGFYVCKSCSRLFDGDWYCLQCVRLCDSCNIRKFAEDFVDWNQSEMSMCADCHGIDEEKYVSGANSEDEIIGEIHGNSHDETCQNDMNSKFENDETMQYDAEGAVDDRENLEYEVDECKDKKKRETLDLEHGTSSKKRLKIMHKK